jgi:beta-glucosidase
MKTTQNLMGIVAFSTLILISQFISAQPFKVSSDDEKKIDQLIGKMTLEEKIGQLIQISGQGELTGPVNQTSDYVTLIREGKLGSMLNVCGSGYTRQVQKIAVEQSRLKIPLLFGYDVIHGYKTIFPVPLAEAASWDPAVAERDARIAAIEATAAGQHWTFAPMVDIARDPRWGRIMEGAGEDTYLGSLLAKARVKGFQGEKLGTGNTILACAKHFAGYGAAEGGRDYNTTDISDRRLREVYLPPFKAAADAGCATFMCAFNEINGVPCSANDVLIRNILKTEWGFKGMVVSDWGSIREMISHGNVANPTEASLLSINAGVDMDMEGNCYATSLKNLVEQEKVDIKLVDDAVRRVLRMKYAMGLFDDPYRYCNDKAEKDLILSKAHRDAARDAACRSMVLLKNDNQVLPLSKNLKSIALIGPLADNGNDIIGNWHAQGKGADAITVLQGFKNKLGNNTKIIYAKGADIEGYNRSLFDDALKAANQADAVVMVMGESEMMSGEALARMDIGLPGIQRELVETVLKTGKPIVLVLMNGRPLTLAWESANIPSILEAWQPGTEGGNAVADVIFGDYNPSGRLPATFPYSVGQIPIYYNHKNTGRPGDDNNRYTSRYIDGPYKPLYEFGHGLSYTTFSYSAPQLSKKEISMTDSLEITVTVSNTGKYTGEETTEFYFRDHVGSVTRPVRELAGIKKTTLKPGESKQVSFTVSSKMLAFYTHSMKFEAEPGDFSLFIGGTPSTLQEVQFKLIP